MKVLKLMSGFPAWESNKGTGNPQGIWPWRPARFDYKTSAGLGQNENSSLGGHRQNLVCTKTQRTGEWPHSGLNPSYLLVLEGLLWKHGSAGAHRRGWGPAAAGQNGPIGLSPLRVHVNPVTEHVDSRAGLPHLDTKGRECSPIHQQRVGLKLYWAGLWAGASSVHGPGPPIRKPSPPESRQEQGEPQSHSG